MQIASGVALGRGVLCVAALIGCGKSEPGKPASAAAGSSAGASGAKVVAAPASAYTLPAKLPATFDEPTRKAALALLDSAPPVAFDEVKDLRVPAGATRSVTPLDAVNFVTYQYANVARDQAGLAFLTLLAADGWIVEKWEVNPGGSVMARIAKDNRDYDAIVGAPKDKEATDANVTVVIAAKPQLGRQVTPPAPVKAPWNRDKRPSPGKLHRTYGKLGYIVYNDNATGWSLLDQLEPSRAAGPAPIESCSVAVGDKVRSPFSRGRDLFPGSIDEVHGGIAHVKFDDGDVHWVECGRIRKR